ncbi:MAG: AtpZ/AtpI family protein [Acidobacteriaceae bacterium]|nr:AtpZ/AtpI family protein [Acidobacteriaceae bacterium]
MIDDRAKQSSTTDGNFVRQVTAKAARKLRVQKDGPQTVWFGLGMSGLIGWSVAVPTVIGALLGLWWDHRHPEAHSWTLMLLVIGLCLGCANAWHWVDQENKAMQDWQEDKHE